MKRKLSQSEEFELMKLVLDKFLWLGVGIMAFGLWNMFTQGVGAGMLYIISGAIVLIIFLVLITREYEHISK